MIPRRLFFFLVAIAAFFGALAGLTSHAQGDVAQVITPDAPLDMTGQLTAFLIDLALRHPWIVTVFGLIGFLRVIFKPAMALLHGYVATTQDKSDDELLEKVERSWIFVAFSWLIDFFGSVKLDTIRKARGPAPTAGGLTPALALCIAASLLSGCQSPETVAFKTISAVQLAAKTTLDGWADHVVERRVQIAKLPEDQQGPASTELLKQEGRVAAALGEYKREMAAAKKGVDAALDQGLAPAPAALVAAAAAFESVVAEMSKK
ncbi:MAG: hypothetical protein U1G08_17840 [Verrucomicrobiota bacterium]